MPHKLTARVSADGETIAFMSRRSLTGYDQKDVATGEAAAEVYRYDASADALSCVSCNPTGARPISRLQEGSGGRFAYVAALLPVWINALFAPRALSADGDRLFFESYDDLLPEDTNGKADVYQWEAPGKGDCEASDPAFVESSGGCLALISSGDGDQDASFVDASPDGEDVFFKTGSSLLPQDRALVDIYDARVGGGFPTPPLPPDPCESGENCQPPVPAPRLSAPGSTAPARQPAGRQAVPQRKGFAERKVREETLPQGQGPAQREMREEAARPPEREGRTMRQRIWQVTAVLLAAMAMSAAPAQAEFGLDDVSVTFSDSLGAPVTQAGSHPFAMTTEINLTTRIDPDLGEVIEGNIKDLTVDLSPGFVVDPTAVPRCSNADFLDFGIAGSACPDDTAIGFIAVRAPGEIKATDFSAVYNLNPAPGQAAKFGMHALGVTVVLSGGVRADGNRNVFAAVSNASQAEPFAGSAVTLWGNPSDPVHDAKRGNCILNGGTCPVSLPERALITLPRSCQGPLLTSFVANSWQSPATFTEATATGDAMTGCDELEFDPAIAAEPSTHAAGSPTGLDFDLDVEDEGLLEPDGLAKSDIAKAVVTLPQGVTTNPAVASGLSACTLAQYEAETAASAPGAGCPESSKVGSVEVVTPLLEEHLGGAIYVAKQSENPFGSLLAIYMVIKSPERGIVVKQAGKVEPDPTTGRLTTTFDDLPQFPFSHFRLHFHEGPRAPLITPPTCGTFTVEADLYPHANPNVPLHETATFAIDSGANGSPCASSEGDLPHKPGFSAGTQSPIAGAYSPFLFRLDREDGSQPLRSIATTLPTGLIGKLAGIPYCSDAQIAQAESRGGEGQGALELSAPSCPPASAVGTVTVGAGAGGEPYYTQGQAYLAGPYKGAPLSLEIVTPAIAGPFDLGTVAVRTALYVDPETARISAVSDPIPTILHGLPLVVRSIALDMNRPSFTLNPTSCEPKSIEGSATSILGATSMLTQYFQASGCANLGFNPKLSLRLKGGTKRDANPALAATLTYPEGSYANIAGAQVTLPRSAFLDQSHIRTVCTRVQFAASQCPKGSVYGRATAITPLLDQPLSGPVYLRSNGGERELPDLVADLNGQIHVVLVGWVDSKNGGLRSTFASVPDAPVSKFTLELQGGDKGLLVNSRDLCRTTNKATAKFTGQNGKIVTLRPLLKSKCKKPGKRGGKQKAGQRLARGSGKPAS